MLFLAVIVMPVAFAENTGHITLLAVSEATQLGSTADLYLKIQDGRGGVYIETAPLTKLDTQLSTRFAQQIGCKFIDKECSNTDFFYTIRSEATIIGGPSAGAAISILTVAMLDNLEINQSVAVTGTINVGGLIGPVAGIIGKIEAAKNAGLTKVLIPKGTRYEIEPEHTYNELLRDYNASYYRYNNETGFYEVDAYEYGKFIGIDVKEVATLQEAVYEITGVLYDADDSEIEPEEWYVQTMEDVAKNLCNRNYELVEELNTINSTLQEELINSTIRAENATANDMFYVAASTCFGGNIRLKYLLLNGIELNETSEMIDNINASTTILQEEIDSKKLQTITDLQTYLVVNERLEEARQTLAEIMLKKAMNNSEEIEYDFAYAEERLYSAEQWAQFFENDGKELDLDDEALKESCVRKLAEAQERYQYVKLITNEEMQKIVNYMDIASIEYEDENYLVCLDMASRAKANLDIILSLVGVQDEEELSELVEERLILVRQVLNKQKEKGLFPMLGYSYYEYAKFLQYDQPYSAMIYSHYALEFSNLDMYFKEKQSKWMIVIDKENMLYFFFGLGSGVLFCCVASLVGRKKKKD